MTGMWQYDLNTKAALGSGGYFALAFADETRNAWCTAANGGNPSSLVPRRLKSWLELSAPHFAGTEQHDAQVQLIALARARASARVCVCVCAN